MVSNFIEHLSQASNNLCVKAMEARRRAISNSLFKLMIDKSKPRWWKKKKMAKSVGRQLRWQHKTLGFAIPTENWLKKSKPLFTPTFKGDEIC